MTCKHSHYPELFKIVFRDCNGEIRACGCEVANYLEGCTDVEALETQAGIIVTLSSAIDTFKKVLVDQLNFLASEQLKAIRSQPDSDIIQVSKDFWESREENDDSTQ